MEHPFFGQLRYPWHRQEADLFHEMLVEVVQNPAQIDLFYKKCADRLPPLALGAPLLMWKEALENLATHGALRKLCDLAIAQYKQNDRVQNVIRAVVDAKPAIDVTIISHDVLVLDRVNLREQLALLEPDATPLKVLLVRGEPGSGKSHGRYLFERAALDRDAQAIYVNQDIVVTVDDVVRQLFSALEASEKIPPRDTSEDAWYRLVCFKLQELASIKHRSLWIAVDDLGPAQDGAPLLDSNIRKFFEQFALNMVNSAFRKWFRLMLIHYPDGPVPTRWKREFWSEDRTTDADVQHQHVAELLRSWSVAHDLRIVEQELTDIAGEVFAKAAAPALALGNEAPRLRRVHDALIETLRNLEKSSQ